MGPAWREAPDADDQASAVNAELSSVNAVFTLSLILIQASSSRQLIRLVTTAIPSIVPCQQVVAWHPRRSGAYYERAPDTAGDALTGLAEPGRLDLGDDAPGWAFPLASQLTGEPVYLVLRGSGNLSGQDIFLLSVLAQLCGNVIAKLELNAELQSTVSALSKIMGVHRSLNEIVASAGEAGIAETVHKLTSLGVLIADEQGRTRATAGAGPDGQVTGEPPGPWRELLRRLEAAPRPVYHGQAWLVLARPRQASGALSR